jgi:hypothetical protein
MKSWLFKPLSGLGKQEGLCQHIGDVVLEISKRTVEMMITEFIKITTF